MPVMDNNRRRWTYTDDDANDWAISAKTEYVSQGGPGTEFVGGSAAAVSVPRIPKNLKPRFVYMSNGTTTRRLVAYEITAPIWTTPGTTVSMSVNGAAVNMDSTTIKVGEKNRDTVRQSA